MDMKNLKLKWKLIVCFSSIFVLMLIIGLASVSSLNRMAKIGEQYAEDIVPTVEEIGLVRRNMISVRRYLLNAIIADNEEDYQRVADAMETDRQALYNSLDVIEQTNANYKTEVAGIRDKLNSVSSINELIMRQSKQFDNERARALAYDIYLEQYAPVFDEAADQVLELNDKIKQSVDAQEKSLRVTRMTAFVIILAILVVCVIFIVIFITLMMRYMLIPVHKLLAGMQALKVGDFEHAAVEYDCKDEFGQLSEAVNSTIERVVFISQDLQYGLKAVAEGNFDAKSQNDAAYTGEFGLLRDAVYELISILNDVMCQISTSSSQVASGAEQVANGAQALSQGATEQASSIQELAATLMSVAQQVDENTQAMTEVECSVDETVAEVGLSTEKMREMLRAMDEISDSSSRIEKIIKNIEDIAFQTNILALNAAVEAARAGMAGKGFAVVADEVRRLAANTAEASRNTAELISQSLRAVENGKTVAQDTAGSLERVNGIIAKLTDQAKRVAVNSKQQDETIKQTSIGVDQISAVVQNNSATAEESAAASEELSSQAAVMRQLVSRFKIQCNPNQGYEKIQQQAVGTEEPILPCGCSEAYGDKY